MMNKRVVCLVMTVLLIFAMVGCNRNVDVDTTGETQHSVPTEATAVMPDKDATVAQEQDVETAHREDEMVTTVPSTEVATEHSEVVAGGSEDAAAEPTTQETEADVTTQQTEDAEVDAPTEPTKATEAVAQPEPGVSSGSTEGTVTPPQQTEPPHVHSYSVSIVAPGCGTGGYTTYACACGESYTDSYTDALGHNWGEWVTTQEATVSSEGQEIRTCGSCGATESQSIPALPAEQIDIWALEQYGRDYAVSAYGYEADTSMGKSNSGYYPGYSCWFTTMDEGYSEVAACVADTTAALIASGEQIVLEFEGQYYRARINVQVDDCGGGKYVVWVFYG